MNFTELCTEALSQKIKEEEGDDDDDDDDIDLFADILPQLNGLKCKGKDEQHPPHLYQSVQGKAVLL